MIGKLKGLVDTISEDSVILDVGGVGYIVYCPGRVLAALPAKGEAVTLLIETHVREDHIHLFGFRSPQERDWFRLVQTVQGVGTRHALSLLSVFSPAELGRIVIAQDKASLTRAAGVGAKLAARITAELKDKAGKLALSVDGAGDGAAGGSAAAAAASSPGASPEQDEDEGESAEVRDAVSALVNLGYRQVDAYGVIAACYRRHGHEASVETLIRDGLKELAP
jgi:Holliday junction DNA helicase RuvA